MDMLVRYLPELDEMVQQKMSKVPISKRNGKEATMYGYKLEEAIKEYLSTEESMEVLHEIGIKEFWHLDYINSSKQIKKTYENINNVNIEIKTLNKQSFPIILRTGKANYFGIYSCTGKQFLNEFEIFTTLNKVKSFHNNKNFFNLFYYSGMTKDKVKEFYPNEYEKFKKNINKEWKNFIAFMFMGTDKKPRAKIFMFYDREKKMLYVSTIDEYINLIESKNVRGTLKTRMKLTHTKDKKMKFKLANPIWLLSEERNEPYWNMNWNEKYKRIKEIRTKQGRDVNNIEKPIINNRRGN